MKPIIEIKNLSAGYDGRTVLHDVNLSIYERDFLGIIGPNGGGKTTLIKCILGLLKPTGGEIIFHTPEKASTKTTSTLLGYLPQYNSIDRKFPISVEEVILSGLSIQKSLTSRFTPEQKEKGKQIISRMGLGRTRTPFYRAIKRRAAATCPVGTCHHLRPCGIDSR